MYLYRLKESIQLHRSPLVLLLLFFSSVLFLESVYIERYCRETIYIYTVLLILFSITFFILIQFEGILK